MASPLTDYELDDGTSVLYIATEMGFADEQGLESIESELKHLVDLAKRISNQHCVRLSLAPNWVLNEPRLAEQVLAQHTEHQERIKRARTGEASTKKAAAETTTPAQPEFPRYPSR